MNLTLYFRLILTSIFQSSVTHGKLVGLRNSKMAYDNQYFMCPRVYAKDGFNVSLQIHNGNYCTSENGYRKFGHTMEEVEYGYPSDYDEMFEPYASGEDITSSLGSIPVSVLEQIFEKHGGVDWEKTISVDTFNSFTKM